MTTIIPATFTIMASVAWLAAIDQMSQKHEPMATRFAAYLAFTALVLIGGFGIVQIHQQVEPLNHAMATALYCAIQTAGGMIGLRAWQYWRV